MTEMDRGVRVRVGARGLRWRAHRLATGSSVSGHGEGTPLMRWVGMDTCKSEIHVSGDRERARRACESSDENDPR